MIIIWSHIYITVPLKVKVRWIIKDGCCAVIALDGEKCIGKK